MVRLRFAEPSDATAITAIYSPYVSSTVVSFEIAPPDADEVRRRIEATRDLLPWLVCQLDQSVIGYAYASHHASRAAYRWSVDTSVYVDAASHRRGVGRALYAALFGVLVLQGYINAYAGITLPNAASVGLHEAIGFTPVGVYARVGFKFGAWHDVGWWQRALQAHVDVPPEPLALAGLRDHAPVLDALRRGATLVR